jgi:hypothetical protein
VLLTVIVPQVLEGQRRSLQTGLDGISNEIIEDTWVEGIKKAQGDFICFMEVGSFVSEGYFKQNLSLFIDNPSYRKLAMISGVVDLPDESRVYSYHYNASVEPVRRAASKTPYCIQIGFIGGSIVRRSALTKIKPILDGDIVDISANMSIQLWSNGSRIMLNPAATYYAPEEVPESKTLLSMLDGSLISMWKKEMIV